ncbi:MAG: MoaD/ThiS family protein [Chloroflexi bacterium]|nr:MoaD/ThiS family protein [Chloroflexota bacterium]
MTIRVEVHLHAGLVRYAPDASGRSTYQREFPDGARISDVVASFNLPVEGRIIIGLDGEAATPETALHEGARIDLVPPIAGG